MFPIFFVVVFPAIIRCWDLTHFGVDSTYYVSSVAVFRSRAFLALPRSVCYNNITHPTLLEVPWQVDSFFASANNILNTGRHRILEYQEWTNCKDIQDAISLSMEPKKPKVWILDRGNQFCAPKVLSYHLFYNTISETCEFSNIPGEKLNTMVIDHEFGSHGFKAYIGNPGDNTLLVFSLNDLKWWTLKLTEMTIPILTIKCDYLALSKTDPELFIGTKDEYSLFSIDLGSIRSFEGPLPSEENVVIETNVTYLGDKLGKSTGMETDYKAGLSYFMVRDYAVVRWMIGSPVVAEYHNVLAQSYEDFPYVSDLFTDPQNSLWALVNPLSPENCLTTRNGTILEDVPSLDRRAVRILRYNKFIKEIEVEGDMDY